MTTAGQRHDSLVFKAGNTSNAARSRVPCQRNFGFLNDPSSVAATVSHVATAIAPVVDTRTEAIAAIREPGRRWLERGLTNLGHDTLRSLHAYRAKLDEEQHQHRSPDYLIDGLISAGPVGAVKDCVAWLDELAIRTGVKRTALFLDVSGNHQSTTENMTRFATDVLPNLNA